MSSDEQGPSSEARAMATAKRRVWVIRPRRLALEATLAAAIVLAALAASTTTREQPRVVTSSPTTTTTTTTTTASGDGACQRSQVKVEVMVTKGLGKVLVTNTSSSTCTLDGYPNLRFLDATGTSGRASRPAVPGSSNGGPGLTTAPRPALVKLPPGDTAAAELGWGEAPAIGDSRCLAPAKATVTLPGQTAAPLDTRIVVLPGAPAAAIRVCSLVTVEPFQFDGRPALVPPPTPPALLGGFFPETARTWWAIVSSNLTFNAYVARTTDSGARWRTVFATGEGIWSSAFLSSDMAWVATKPVHAGLTPLYRTEDGGQTWAHIGSVPYGCVLQFVNPSDGWCSIVDPTMGIATVQLYRSTDGGATWGLVSASNYAFQGPSTPDALPTDCDKTITFTSPEDGWATSFCNAGTPWIYATTDGGTHWSPLPAVPLPAGAPVPAGQGLGTPAVAGADLATAMSIGGQPNTTAIATTSDSGQTWHSQLVPTPTKHWNVDLIDPSHWILTNGTNLMATNNAGATWRTWTPSRPMKDTDGDPLTLDFLTPQLGWAIPTGDSRPFWWTTNGGTTWKPVTIKAGPYILNPTP